MLAILVLGLIIYIILFVFAFNFRESWTENFFRITGGYILFIAIPYIFGFHFFFVLYLGILLFMAYQDGKNA